MERSDKTLLCLGAVHLDVTTCSLHGEKAENSEQLATGHEELFFFFLASLDCESGNVQGSCQPGHVAWCCARVLQTHRTKQSKNLYTFFVVIAVLSFFFLSFFCNLLKFLKLLYHMFFFYAISTRYLLGII